VYATYVLWSEMKGKHYVGHTHDLERRLTEHRSARAGYTARASDWRPVYVKRHATREGAARHERRIKKTGVRIFLARIDARLGLSPAASPASEG
jgi:putative endonuclease